MEQVSENLPINVHQALFMANFKGPEPRFAHILAVGDDSGPELFAILHLHDRGHDWHDHSHGNV